MWDVAKNHNVIHDDMNNEQFCNDPRCNLNREGIRYSHDKPTNRKLSAKKN
ncbi:MAG: hypothetical protein OEL84_00730 [Nitrosopumilus sp.]|nr:hypothetical protein [Nitrosopumilus sp.]